MDEIVFYEDDYCNIELLRNENIEYVRVQLEEIERYSTEHRNGSGYTDMYTRRKEPVSLLASNIAVDVFEKQLNRIAPRCDQVLIKCGGTVKACDHILAYGENKNVVVFIEYSKTLVAKMWFTLDIRDDVDCVTAQTIFSALRDVGDFILIDWNWEVIVDINNEESIKQYLGNRLRVFMSK